MWAPLGVEVSSAEEAFTTYTGCRTLPQSPSCWLCLLWASSSKEAVSAARVVAMEDFHPHNDEMIFNADEAHNIVKECIESVLGKADYNHNKVNQWTAAIVEQSLTHLVKLGKTYKYIVTCAVMQRSGAGLHTASSCFWDTTTDGTCTVRWENRTMNCIVNVFAVAIIL